MSKQLAYNHLIMQCEAGSHLYGTATPDSDRDYLGITVEPPEYVMGLKKFESWVAPTGEGKNTVEDTDITIYSLRKFAALAAKGNPNLLSLLFVMRQNRIEVDAHPGHWQSVLAVTDAFLSKQIAKPFIGYMESQLAALRGERGSKVHRPDLVEQHGYDTKFAYHAIRLGFQGVEVLEHGYMQLPIDPAKVNALKDIRSGLWTIEDVLWWGDKLKSELHRWEQRTGLPDAPDYDTINAMLVDVHREYWAQSEGLTMERGL